MLNDTKHAAGAQGVSRYNRPRSEAAAHTHSHADTTLDAFACTTPSIIMRGDV